MTDIISKFVFSDYYKTVSITFELNDSNFIFEKK